MELTDLTWPRQTARLTLRAMAEADLPTVYAYRSRPAVYEWITTAHTSLDDFCTRVQRQLSETDRLLLLVAELDGDVIGDGMVKLTNGWAQDDLPAAQRCQAEIGYVIDDGYAGRGLATELTGELLRIGFADLGLRRMEAGCFADNLASRRVLEKCGFRLEGYFVRESLHRTRGWLDGCAYGVLAQDWVG
ncbi:GNAT family N-acetyltransferase [Naumannella sp. ID2617S]|uniref:GNAT family N-acetyltransferase n=1 Tax=Enemella dayhoffiae TaxID=2016507 RepID=A0A255HFP8_9ACTN|nr:GNAT family N-acetyltransferase [Enemella dayhoffiae]NNG20087.1 GNAT family N-acetyltransferase [Naumannella sp. ID2617S]OYO25294.1 GNAT family N-acetyltransferase [Enemella dayhoffiae]